MQGKKQAFTLIELLVVILIIGILAAVAVPQYQKAIVKSRNAEMKQIVKTVAVAQEAYYLANGKWAVDFNELDLDLPLESPKTIVDGHYGKCRTHVYGTDSARVGKNYYVALNSADATSEMLVVAYWDSGHYACAGFGMSLASSDSVLKNLHCREAINNSYSAGAGVFCTKVEQGSYYNKSTIWRWYRLP